VQVELHEYVAVLGREVLQRVEYHDAVDHPVGVVVLDRHGRRRLGHLHGPDFSGPGPVDDGCGSR
jgi:hypothetical protein